ncbi:hypothetical protein [Bdellovibrio reynosensis]|uniref:Flp pilus assembly protein CpaB n=1 Tax=Bdellovibrio reynosensis TaxID=2835041 RepID=A0ABY4C531_9BACT|nr:hypothetical protein [Bdellovibrio reynosensis]UOF00068.1 hypothetical protein MNR06_10180 [Bdellovibrio reynosensis]
MARRFAVVFFLILLGVVVLYLSRTNDKSASLKSSNGDTKSVTSVAAENPEPIQITESASTSSNEPVVSNRTIDKALTHRKVSSLSVGKAELEKIPLLADTPWKLWKGVTAKPKAATSPNEVIVSEISGFVLVQSEANVDLTNFTTSAPVVVANPRLNIGGVLTGTITVVLREGQSADFLSAESGIKIIGSFPKIRTYFVTALQEPFDLPELYQELKHHQGVEQVSLEILSRQYDKF